MTEMEVPLYVAWENSIGQLRYQPRLPDGRTLRAVVPLHLEPLHLEPWQPPGLQSLGLRASNEAWQARKRAREFKLKETPS